MKITEKEIKAINKIVYIQIQTKTGLSKRYGIRLKLIN